MSLGTRLKEARASHKMSQQGLAAKMKDCQFGWSQTTVSKVETDAREISFNEAIVLARMLGFTMEWLATGDDESSLPMLTYRDGFRDGAMSVRRKLLAVFDDD